MKKAIVLVMIFVMMFSMSVSVFAEIVFESKPMKFVTTGKDEDQAYTNCESIVDTYAFMHGYNDYCMFDTQYVKTATRVWCTHTVTFWIIEGE